MELTQKVTTYNEDNLYDEFAFNIANILLQATLARYF